MKKKLIVVVPIIRNAEILCFESEDITARLPELEALGYGPGVIKAYVNAGILKELED